MVGRKKEIEELNRLFDSNESEFVAIYGRRRVGKTFLVRETFADRFVFHHTGLPNATKRQQLSHFRSSLAAFGNTRAALTDWFEAFDSLREVILRSNLRR